MIRFGLCCIFKAQPIKFRRTTAKYLSGFSQKERKTYISRLCLDNADSLMKALDYCREHSIGAFRINSQVLPLKTHPQMGYDIEELPGSGKLIASLKACGEFSRKHDIRTSFHPDQFTVLNSPKPDVVHRSVLDLEYQAQVAEWVNADVINIHAGGVYGDKSSAVSRLIKTIDTLPDPVKKRLTLENDDKSYSPSDLLPVCHHLNIPMVYDVHHHRCFPDSLSVDEATQKAMETWNREPLFHLSSPRDGWGAPNPRMHHDFIDINDLPRDWLHKDITVEVEAKAKELAIKQLMQDLNRIPA